MCKEKLRHFIMLTTYGSPEKKKGSWSQLLFELFLLLLVVAELGLRIGLAVFLAGILNKMSAFYVLLITKASSSCYSIKVRNKHKEDFISRLPDVILCTILSKLATKEAVRTSVLSTRWRNVYVLLPSLSMKCLCTFKSMPLDQHCNCCPQYQQGFSTFLDRFLQLPRHHKMTSFQLSLCLGREYAADLKRWMHCLARMGIEELQLKFSCDTFVTNMPGNCNITDRISFPFQLLSETSMLRSLCLSSCNLEPNFQGPFRSLMSLRLNAVPLVDREVQNILLSCPKLESLTLRYCGLPSTLFLGGPEIGLKFLMISSCFGVEEIVVCAGNLTSLEIVCTNRIKFSPSNVPQLQQIYYCSDGFDDLCYIIDEVAKGVPQVESLYIESAISTVSYLPQEMYPLEKAMSEVSNLSFSNLRELYLHLVFNVVFDVQQLAYLVEACPLLQRFHLGTRSSTTRHSISLVPIYPVYHNHLKEIDYGGFWGMENEMQLVTFLLQSAVSLEQFVISPYFRYYIGEGRWRWNRIGGLALRKQVRETLDQLFRQQARSKTARLIVR